MLGRVVNFIASSLHTGIAGSAACLREGLDANGMMLAKHRKCRSRHLEVQTETPTAEPGNP